MQLLESAAFAAWPSEHCIDLGGWLLRLDRGYTRRANSANATVLALGLSDADIDAMEARFRRSGLTPTFRITSFAPVAEVDARLGRRGYAHCDVSLVMTRSLSAADNAVATPLLEDAGSWLEAFQAITGKAEANQAAHLAILQRIEHACAWAVHSASASPQCCGLGVLVDGNLGLFDIATAPAWRRQGLAAQLCRGLMDWGQRQGAHTAFLQVAAANEPAVQLYVKLGFHPAYRYWYRVLQEVPAGCASPADAG